MPALRSRNFARSPTLNGARSPSLKGRTAFGRCRRACPEFHSASPWWPASRSCCRRRPQSRTALQRRRSRIGEIKMRLIRSSIQGSDKSSAPRHACGGGVYWARWPSGAGRLRSACGDAVGPARRNEALCASARHFNFRIRQRSARCCADRAIGATSRDHGKAHSFRRDVSCSSPFQA